MTYANRVALFCFFFGLARSHCPPCHGGRSFLQAKVAPWKNFIPPASNAPISPCGCGVDRVTPRDDIREMPPSKQREMIAALEKDTDSMKEQLETMQSENGDSLDDLQARLKAAMKANIKQDADMIKSAEKQGDSRKQAKSAINNMMKQAEEATGDIAEHRSMLKELQSDVTMRLMDMRSCGCEADGSLLSMKAGPNFELIRKIENLERERNELSEEISEEQRRFGDEQRQLMHRIDIVKGKMGRRESANAKYDKEDKGKAKGIQRQDQATEAFLDAKKEQLKRIEKDAEEAQKYYDKLEKALGKCGCGPKAL